jgi:hypothetical protein
MNTAAKIAQHKEKNPNLYCPRCLWRTGGGFCPRHRPVRKEPLSVVDEGGRSAHV